MAEDLVSMAVEVVSALNSLNENEFGSITSSDFKITLNEFDEEAGIGIKAQLLLAGPTLNKVKNDGHALYPDKTDEDMFVYISLKVSDDAANLVDQIKGLIDAFGLPMDAVEQFGELKFHAGDGEVLIGFKAGVDHSSNFQPFILKSGVFGNGSTDITMDVSFNLGTTWDGMLDDEPILSHILKGVSIHTKGWLHDKTRENVLKIVGEKNEVATSPTSSPLPFLMPLLFFKRITGAVELECTDEMKEQIKTFIASNVPPALMSLKEAFDMVKSMGLPLEMIQPILELVQSAGIREISIVGAANLGVKLTIRLPGLDKAIAEFLSG